MGTVSYSNTPKVPFLDFDLSKLSINSNYNIIFHYVFNPFGKFETEYNFLLDPSLDENTLVILWHAVEMGVWDQSWIDKLNAIVKNAPFKLVYLTACTSQLDLDKFFSIDFDVEFFPAFDTRGANLWDGQPAEITLDKSKKFSCLNAKDGPHRRFIFSQLYHNGLLPEGNASYKCTNWGLDFKKEFFYFFKGQGFTDEQLTEINTATDSIESMLPIMLDDYNIANKLARETFTDTYINIVNETDYINVPHYYRKGFVTEKTFNAIANNQMFIIVGHATSLQTVIDMGYKTFDGIIDESYDTILNNGDRLLAVRNEIIRFLNRPIEQIRDDYIKVQDIIKYNRDRLFAQNLSTRFQDLLDRYAR
jgi:hypothetical protein